MMVIDKFLNEEQDPKTIEKVVGKLSDLMSGNEELLYIAVQKKPAVNLMPDSIALSNKRLFYCEPANFGITMNFKDISWKSIKEVSFKEEIFGSKFICVPQQGENIVTEYIPKVQARKLYQAAKEELAKYQEEIKAVELEAKKVTEIATQEEIIVPEMLIVEPTPLPQPEPIEEPEDETTLKLRKLKTLFDKQLITLEEYEAKKASILESF